MWIVKRKWRFRGFRGRWFQIWWPQIEIREELEKSILNFSKSNFRPQNSKSKSNFKFWEAKFWILEVDFEFPSPKSKIEIEFQILMSRFLIFWNKILNSYPKNSKSKSEIEFQVLMSRFLIFRKPNFSISDFGRVDFCIFIPFQPKILKF